MYRIDFIDAIGKPRVQFFKVRSQAEKRVNELKSCNLAMVHTNWNYILPKDRDEDCQPMELNSCLEVDNGE